MSDAARILEISPPAELNLRHGRFVATSFRITEGKIETVHLALVMGRPREGALLRISSACVTGEVFGCDRCDCAAQLDLALQMIAHEGDGLLTYHPDEEGYGLGLHEKICSYAAQPLSERAVGHTPPPEDVRTFVPSALIVAEFGLRSVRLLSANEKKADALRARGIEAQLIPLPAPPPTA